MNGFMGRLIHVIKLLLTRLNFPLQTKTVVIKTVEEFDSVNIRFLL